jgi:hypothetical protein
LWFRLLVALRVSGSAASPECFPLRSTTMTEVCQMVDENV